MTSRTGKRLLPRIEHEAVLVVREFLKAIDERGLRPGHRVGDAG